jgi:hypothetical protein
LWTDDLSFQLGPPTDDLAAAMFLNRSMELNWIALRLLPYMRRPDTPPSEDWNAKWSLLDDSFKFMFDGFNELGKKTAPALLRNAAGKIQIRSGHVFH